MTDTSTHVFTCSQRGQRWLMFVTVMFVVLIITMVVLLLAYGFVEDMEDAAYLLVMLAITGYVVFAMYCNWKTYLYAEDCSLEINMLTRTFTYRHKDKKVVFKPENVAHWYWDTGLYLSRVSANHTIIVLKSGEELPVYSWLFEDNHFFLSDYRKYNACHFISAHEEELLFPETEYAKGYRYLFPPEEK